jgi:WD40 repeat protein
MPDAFFSYSRQDGDFVRRLAGELQERGKEVWVDVDGIRDTERFPEALRRAIESSDAFVFVISPDSVSSEFCEQEVAHAAGLNKRIVPLALRQVPDAELPEEIRFRNWIPVDGEAPFEAGVDRVVAALETDLEWERQHTRVTVKALEWDGSGRDKSFLLRGADLKAGEGWLAAGVDKDPGPTALEQEYLLAGRQAATRRQRALVGGSLAIAVVAVGLLIFALISRGQAISARNAARAAARTTKSRALAAESQTQLSVDPERSILLAAAAVRTSATPQAMFALRGAIDASPIRFRLPDVAPQPCAPATTETPGPLSPGVAFSPDGSQVAEALCDGTVVLASGKSGRVVRRVHLGRGLAGRLVYNRASALLVAVGAGRVAAIDPTTGAVRERGPAVGSYTGLASNPNAPVVAFAGKRGVALWDLRTHVARTLSLPDGLTAGMLAFSPDGRRLAVALNVTAPDQRIMALVLDTRTGRILATLNNHSAFQCDDLAFSPDGRELVLGELAPNGGGAVVLRDARTFALRADLVRFATGKQMTAVAFSPDGSRVAYGTVDGTAALVSAASGQTIVSYLGHTAAISQVAFSPDGRLVMTGSTDGTVRVWRGQRLALHTAAPNAYPWSIVPLAAGFAGIGFAPSSLTAQLWTRELRPAAPSLTLSRNGSAGFVLASAGPLAGIIPGDPGRRGRISIWNILQRRVIRRVPPTRLPNHSPLLSPDGRTIAAGVPLGRGWAIGLLDTRTGAYRILARTSCSTGPRFAFSRDGRLVAAGGACGEAAVWNVASGRRVGRPVTVGAGTLIGRLAFSPDGRQLALPASDDAVTVVNALTGATLAVLTDHTRLVEAAAYSPNGHYLVTTSDDGTADIYDAHTFTLLRTIHDPGTAVSGAVFTHNSQDLLTWDTKGVIAEWDTCTDCQNPRALLALAASRVTRQLTPSERRTFGIG